MLKKVVFTILTLIMVYSGTVVVFEYFEPSKEPAGSVATSSLDYETLKEYVLSSPDAVTHYFFFYNGSDQSSDYIRDTVLTIAGNETNLDMNTIIETVDVTELMASEQADRLMSEWGIVSCPAFARVSVSEGEIVTDNILLYDENDPLNAARFEEWLKANGIWSGN